MKDLLSYQVQKKKKDPPIAVGMIMKGQIMQPYNSITIKIKQKLPPLWDNEGLDYATLPA